MDPKQITEIRQLIHLLHKDRIILFSSHMLAEVEQLCDRVIILHEGTVRLDAPMSRLHGEGDPVSLRVTLEAQESRALPLLLQLDGIKKVQAISSQQDGASTFRLTFRKNAQPENRLFSLCCGHRLPILALKREDSGLEEVFLQVIAGREAPQC